MRTLALLACMVLALPASAGAEGAPRVTVLRLEGAIAPASLRYVQRGLHEAAEAGAALVVLELDELLDTLEFFLRPLRGPTASAPEEAEVAHEEGSH